MGLNCDSSVRSKLDGHDDKFCIVHVLLSNLGYKLIVLLRRPFFCWLICTLRMFLDGFCDPSLCHNDSECTIFVSTSL